VQHRRITAQNGSIPRSNAITRTHPHQAALPQLNTTPEVQYDDHEATDIIGSTADIISDGTVQYPTLHRPPTEVQLSSSNSLSMALIFGASVNDYWPPKATPPPAVDNVTPRQPITISEFSTLAGALDNSSSGWTCLGFDNTTWEDLLEAIPIAQADSATHSPGFTDLSIVLQPTAGNNDYEPAPYQLPATRSEDDDIPTSHADPNTIPISQFSSLTAALDDNWTQFGWIW